MKAGTGLLLALLAMSATQLAAQEGVPDPTFATAGRSEFVPIESEARAIFFNAIKPLPDGNLLVAGYIDYALPLPLAEPKTRIAIAKLTANGAPDVTYGNAPEYPGMMLFGDINLGSRMQEARSIAVLADGSAVVGGILDSWLFGGFTLRLDSSGVPVDGYGDAGMSLLPFQVMDLDVDSRGRVVVAGKSRGVKPSSRGVVARIDGTTGNLDTTFGGDGVVDLLEFAADGSVLNHLGGLQAIAVTAQDDVVVGGFQEGDASQVRYSLAKFVDGEFDASFAEGGWWRFVPAWPHAYVPDGLADIAIMPGGDIVLAGQYTDDANNKFPMLGRLSAEGVPQPEFGETEYPGFRRLDVRAGFGYQRPTALALQNDGKILYTAMAVADGQVSDFVVGRVDAQGAPDASFGIGGVSIIGMPPSSEFAHARGISLQAGRPVVVGANGRRADPESPMFTRAVVMRLSTDRVFAAGFDPLE